MQQVLKGLVVVMGILILAGLGVITVTLVGRSSSSGGDAFDRLSLGLPAGSRVVSSAASGARLALTVRLPDGSERVVIVDMARGKRLGTVTLSDPR